jgi:2-C-methyl-D-erythritol 4-phosphate cytidylyltransferase
MGEGIDKQLVRVGGKPIMIFSLEILLDHPSIDRAVIACQPDRDDEIAAILADYRLDEKCQIVSGGDTRQESVRLGLEAVSSSRVLVHEAARPLITAELIDRLVAEAAPAVVPTIEIPFSVAIGGDVMTAETDRATLRNIQLPQLFDTQVLRDAHTRARDEGQSSTEDSSLVFRTGHEVRFVEGLSENLKVTYPLDLVVAETLLFGEMHS